MNDASTNSNESQRQVDPMLRSGLFGVASVCMLGGVLRAFGVGEWDWQTLLFFVSAGVMFLLPWATHVKLGKDGFEVQLPDSVNSIGVGGPRKPDAIPTPASVAALGPAAATEALLADPTHEDDPQRGKWGG